MIIPAGSYPRPNEDTHIDYDKNAEHTEGLDEVFNPIYHAGMCEAMFMIWYDIMISSILYWWIINVVIIINRFQFGYIWQS